MILCPEPDNKRPHGNTTIPDPDREPSRNNPDQPTPPPAVSTAPRPKRHQGTADGSPAASLSTASALQGTNLSKANLTGANLTGSDFSDADFSDADLSKAALTRATLTNAALTGVKGLTQAQLDKACASQYLPPQLNGARDSNTGKPLIWNPAAGHGRWVNPGD